MSHAARAGRSVVFASVIAAVALVLAAAPAADAATSSQPVQFSEDGIHWSDSYSGTLFGGVLLVPGDSVDRAFYVRNNAGQPAAMRVTLYDVATTDTDLASAMTVSTSTPSIPGSAVPVTAAQPCATLSHGQVLAAGDGIRLDTVVALADLNGTTAQAQNVSFKLAISLSSTDSAAPAPDTCPTDFGGTVIGTTDPGTGTTSHPVYHLGAGGWTPTPATGPTPAPTPGPTSSPEPQPGNPIAGSLAANTMRLFQENFVLLWLAMVVLGALFFLFINGRRSRDDDDTTPYHPYSRQPASEIGTRR